MRYRAKRRRKLQFGLAHRLAASGGAAAELIMRAPIGIFRAWIGQLLGSKRRFSRRGGTFERRKSLDFSANSPSGRLPEREIRSAI